MTRCNWGKTLLTSEIYQSYHDDEWGNPSYDDRHLFEMLVLESFHVGLSWLIILNKREAFREAFDHFDAQKIVKYDENKINELLNNKAIVRHKGKILATIQNANAFLEVKKEFRSFSDYIWSFTDNQIVYNNTDVFVTRSELSDKVTKDLKKRGFKFLGSVTVYSYLEAVGIMNNHQKECFKYHGKKVK